MPRNPGGRQPRKPPPLRKNGDVDRRGSHTHKADDELPNGDAAQVERELRRVKIAALMGQHLTQAEIAERVGVSQATVNNDMTAIRMEWRAMRLQHFERTKDEVHGWALENYRKAHALLERATNAADIPTARLCLQEARKCGAEVSKLLGLYPATQRDLDLREAEAKLMALLSLTDPNQLPM